MNREILFKAKRKDTKEWVYGYLVEYADYNTIYINGSHPKTSYIFPMGERSQLKSLEKRIEVIPETVCQYTGLNDETGKKIFENDIVRAIKTLPCFDEDVEGQVYFEIPNGIELKIEEDEIVHFGYLEDIEVIGNIYDDGELIC